MRGPLGGGLLARVALDVPATLPGLALWYDGRQSGLTAGNQIATVPFGRVARIAQPAPLTGSWTATTNPPWRSAAALDFHAYGPGYTLGSSLTQPPAVAMTGNNCTIALAWQNRQGGGFGVFFSAPVGARLIGLYEIGGQLVLANASTLTPIPGIAPGIVAGHRICQCTLIIVCGPTQYDIRFTVNGTAYTTSVPVTPSSAAIGDFVIGANAATQALMAGSSQAAISQFLVYANTLSSAPQTKLQNFLLVNGPPGFPTSAPLVAMAGDSICEAWPAGVQPMFDPTAPRWLNAGVAGAHDTIPSEIPAFYTTDVLPYYSPARAKNIIVCEGISVNDIAYRLAQGDSVPVASATILAAYYAYCGRAKADGWLPLVCTLTPNLGGPTYDAIRAIVNTDIRANWAPYGSVLYDVGATPGMSTTADAANPALFYDGTHPTELGYEILNTTLQPAIAAALALP